jgi:hypothetical protein
MIPTIMSRTAIATMTMTSTADTPRNDPINLPPTHHSTATAQITMTTKMAGGWIILLTVAMDGPTSIDTKATEAIVLYVTLSWGDEISGIYHSFFLSASRYITAVATAISGLEQMGDTRFLDARRNLEDVLASERGGERSIVTVLLLYVSYNAFLSRTKRLVFR